MTLNRECVHPREKVMEFNEQQLPAFEVFLMLLISTQIIWDIQTFQCFRTERNFSFNKTGSSQVGAISKAQKYSKNNYWKHLEKLFFSKKNFEFFFEKKYFFRKSHNAEKLKKRPFRVIKRFYKPKTSKKMQGVTL